MKFYTYDQNNSGGGFSDDPRVAHYVIVEAESAEEANARAEAAGVYFDGAGVIDCECCGDRWTRADETEATHVPAIYDQPLSSAKALFVGLSETWVVYYADGRVERGVLPRGGS